MTDITPRPYQQESCDAVFRYLTDGTWQPDRAGLIVLPTAAGKTIVFSLLIRKFWDVGARSCLILAHRKELVSQAEKKLLKVWPEAPTGVYSASLNRREIQPITIGSRDTVVGFLEYRPHFDVLIVDEAHNISKQEKTQYQKIIAALRAANPRIVILGVTATAFRTDSGVIYGENELFTDLIFEYSLKQLLADGYICPIEARQVENAAEINTQGLAKYMGDFQTKAMAERADQPDIVSRALANWHLNAQKFERKCSVFYAVNVAHANHISKALWDEYGMNCPVIDGTTPQSDRDFILEGVECGALPGVVNVGVLTEGWDCPRVDCIVLMLATASLVKYIQIIGRGLRTHPGKEYTLLLDFGGNIARFGPIDVARPAGSGRKGEAPRVRACPACGLVNKPFVRECAGCKHQLIKDSTPCPGCGEECLKIAVQCWNCDHVFVSHSDKPSQGAVLFESERQLRRFKVDRVRAQTMLSKNMNPFLQVVYSSTAPSGKTRIFLRSLMIGMPGKPGREAMKAWREITNDSTPTPATPGEAAAICLQSGVLRPVESLLADLSGRWPTIVSVKYKNQGETDEQVEAA